MAFRFKHGDRPLDDFSVQRAVGAGGFGEVYYAVSDGGREVALKYLRQFPEVELRGVSHCINLKSPHLVSIFDVKKNADGEYFIIMEYCSGPSLRDLLIAEPNGFAPEKAAFFVREIAKGLSYLHQRGIVHRDLKPGNIFFDDGYVKIGDYGLSKFISVSRHSAQTASVGTVHYMAPEIGSGDYSRSVDIYALGVILYEMLLGRVPFEGSTMGEILMKHLTAQPAIDALPAPFGQVIRKALAKDPRDRYQTVDEMVDGLLVVDEVRQSLDGFSTKSLEGAVRAGGGDRMDSPWPSPNPIPGFARGGAGHAVVPPVFHPSFPLPERVQRKLDKVSKKVDRRLHKLQGKTAARFDERGPAGRHRLRMPFPKGEGGRARYALPALGLSAGILGGIALLFVTTVHEDYGGTAALLTLCMSVAIGLSHRVVRWFGVSSGPYWAQRVARLFVCAPLVCLGAAPLLSQSRFEAEGSAIVVALLLVCVFRNWERDIEQGIFGELNIWGGLASGFFTAGIPAAIFAGMWDAGHEEYAMFLAGAVLLAVILLVQCNVWWMASRGAVAERIAQGSKSKERAADEAVAQQNTGQQALTTGKETSDMPGRDFSEPPFRWIMKVEAGVGNSERDSGEPAPRWFLTRVFWSLVAFVLTGVCIASLALSIIAERFHHHEHLAAVIVCVASGCMLVFAMRKTTFYRRETFWRDSVRPFLQSLCFAVIGSMAAVMAIEWDHFENYNGTRYDCLDDGGRAAVITALVLSSLLLIVVSAVRGRRQVHSFLNGTPESSADGNRGAAARSPVYNGVQEAESA